MYDYLRESTDEKETMLRALATLSALLDIDYTIYPSNDRITCEHFAIRKSEGWDDAFVFPNGLSKFQRPATITATINEAIKFIRPFLPNQDRTEAYKAHCARLDVEP